MQGVRQVAPVEGLASAPGGSDSMVSDTLAPPPIDMLGIQSQLQPAQPPSRRTPHKALTRTSIDIMLPRPPAAVRHLDLTSRICAAQHAVGGEKRRRQGDTCAQAVEPSNLVGGAETAPVL